MNQINENNLLQSGWTKTRTEAALPYVVKEYKQGNTSIKNYQNIEFPEDDQYILKIDVSKISVENLNKIIKLAALT